MTRLRGLIIEGFARTKEPLTILIIRLLHNSLQTSAKFSRIIPTPTQCMLGQMLGHV